MTTDEIIDSIIVDLNTLVKDLSNGQFLQFCLIISQITQKLINLKNDISADVDSLRDKVETLKRINDSISNQKDLAEKDGATDGSD